MDENFRINPAPANTVNGTMTNQTRSWGNGLIAGHTAQSDVVQPIPNREDASCMHHPEEQVPLPICAKSDIADIRSRTELLKILGPRVFLPIPCGKEEPEEPSWRDWEETTTRATLITWDETQKNIGVLLGPVSGGLYCVELATSAATEEFLGINPRLRNAPQVVGARGCKCFFLLEESAPPTANILNTVGETVARWFGKGIQAVVFGQHSSGMSYQWKHIGSLTQMPFSEIVWPPGWKSSCIKTSIDRPVRDFGPPLIVKFSRKGEPKLRTLNQTSLADRFTREHDMIFEPTENKFYSYDIATGLWLNRSEAKLLIELSFDLQKVGKEYGVEEDVISARSTHALGEIVKQAKGMSEKRDAFNRDPMSTIIHTKNGMLDLDNNPIVLLPFSREYYSRNQSPFPYLPDAKCEQFLNCVLKPALSEDDVFLLQRWFGSVLLGFNRAQRIMIKHGMGGNGKSTVDEILDAIIGNANVLQLRTELLADRFELSRCAGKTLLSGKDVPPDFLQSKGAHVLKTLVGNDQLSAEAKYSNDTIKLRGGVAVSITANTKLHVKLQGDYRAWQRRLMIISFERPVTFERIESFAHQLIEKEGPGILAWAVEGARAHLAELKSHGDFVLTTAQKKRVDDLLMESDSLRHYVTNFIGTSGNNDVTGDEIIHGYVAFCDSEGWATNSTRQIQNELPDLMLEIHRANRRQDIKRGGLAQRGYAGVALRKFAAAA